MACKYLQVKKVSIIYGKLFSGDLVHELYSSAKLGLFLEMWVTTPYSTFYLAFQSASTLIERRFYPMMEAQCCRSMKEPFLVYSGHFSSVMLRSDGI